MSSERVKEHGNYLRRASLADMDKLMEWRMEVLHEVFENPPDEAMLDMHSANLAYYRQEIPTGNARRGVCGKRSGDRGLRRRVPVPGDALAREPTGTVRAYLMNIYTRKAHRARRAWGGASSAGSLTGPNSGAS